MELKLSLRHAGTDISATVKGDNVAQLVMQIPELLNEMVRHLATRKEGDLPKGVTYEPENV